MSGPVVKTPFTAVLVLLSLGAGYRFRAGDE